MRLRAMWITVDAILRSDPTPIIQFSCAFGTGHGSWETGVPQVDRGYYVEFDFMHPLVPGVNTKHALRGSPHIGHVDDCTTIVAVIEDVHENCTASLRFGSSLILVEYRGTFPARRTWIEVGSSHLGLFDRNI